MATVISPLFLRRWAIALFIFGAASVAHAARVETMTVSRDDNAYTVHARLRLGVNQALAWRAATDFEHLPDYDPVIRSSQRVGHHELDSTMRLCVLWYCKNVRQVMRYSLDAPRAIDMQVILGKGDLRAGSAHWRFSPRGRQTALVFNARIIPGFWTPPLVGPPLVARELRKQVRATGIAIEKLAGRYVGSGSRD